MPNIAYVAKDDNTVSVVNIDTNIVLANIPVGFTPNYIAITPDGKKAYLANFSGSSVSVLDLTSNTIIAVIPLGMNNNSNNQPSTILIIPNGKRAYTGNVDGTISIIDTSTDKLINTLDIGGPVIILSPDGKYIYAVSGNSVAVISTINNIVVNIIPIPNFSDSLAITPDGSRLYVAISGTFPSYDNRVVVIDTVTSSIIATLNVGTRPINVAIDAFGNRAYIVVNGNYFMGSGISSVAVIDIQTNVVIATIPVGNNPTYELITPNGSKVFVINTNPNTGDITAINTVTNTTSSIMVGNSPVNMAIIPDGSKLIVTTTGNYIAIVDTATQSFYQLVIGASSSFITLAPQTSLTQQVVYSTGVIRNSGAESVSLYVVNESYQNDAVIEVIAFIIPNTVGMKTPIQHNLYLVPTNTVDKKEINISGLLAYEIQISVSSLTIHSIVLSLYGLVTNGNVVPEQKELQSCLTIIPELSYSP
jgi:YVTN family beta-propeller protein